MKTQFILRFIELAIILQYPDIQGSEIRYDINFRYYLKQDSVFNKNELFDAIKNHGIIIDEETDIYIHEEETFVDLSCFNCVLIPIDPNEQTPSSFNERPEK